MSKKYIVMLDDVGYFKNILEAIRQSSADCIFSKSLSKLQTKLFRVHNMWKLNSKIEMPFKKYWFNKCLDESRIDDNEECVFLFFESYYLSYSKKYLTYIKNKYKRAKIAFIWLNPIDQYLEKKYCAIKCFYDYAITFDKSDANKYGFSYYPGTLFWIPEMKTRNEYDLFFVGADKGRHNQLLNIYNHAKKNNLNCLFYITGVKPEDQIISNEIVYNKSISYSEVLEKSASSRCIVEVLKENRDYCSIRTAEAYYLKKKLLTTNDNITEEPYYRKEIVSKINNNGTFDVGFVRDNNNKEELYDKKFCTFDSFQTYLESLFAK